jgi:hypothetical protein
MLSVRCITQDCYWLPHLTRTFPGVQLEVASGADLKSLTSAAPKEKIDILILDFDAFVETADEQSMLLMRAIESANQVIAIISKKLASMTDIVARSKHVHVLHKPVTAGEITLAMNRAIRVLAPPE